MEKICIIDLSEIYIKQDQPYTSPLDVARELLVRINNEITLRRYAGLAGNIKNKAALDHLIQAYVERYQAVEGDKRLEERALLPEYNNIMPILCLLKFIILRYMFCSYFLIISILLSCVIYIVFSIHIFT